MSSNGAKAFAMNEGKHILELMEKLLSMSKDSSSTEYYTLESELYSHFMNINGLLEALKAIGDEETTKMINDLNEQKSVLMKLRKEEQKQPNSSELIDNEAGSDDVMPEDVEMPDLSTMNEIGNVENVKKSSVSTSLIYSICIIVIIAVAWMYFANSD